MQSASKLSKNEREKNEEKKPNKKLRHNYFR